MDYDRYDPRRQDEQSRWLLAMLLIMALIGIVRELSASGGHGRSRAEPLEAIGDGPPPPLR